MKLLLTDKQKKTISKLLQREIDLSLSEMRVESEDWGLGEMDELDEITSIDNILVNRLEFSDNTILIYLDIFLNKDRDYFDNVIAEIYWRFKKWFPKFKIIENYIINGSDAMSLNEDFEITNDVLDTIKEKANIEYSRVQKEIESLKKQLKDVESLLDRFDDDELFNKLAEIGSRDTAMEIIQRLKKDNEHTLFKIKSNLGRLEKQTLDSILNRMIDSYKAVENERIDRENRLKNATITKDTLINLFVTALEGGSNYWYYILNTPNEVREIMQDQGITYTEAIGEYVLNGGEIEIRDVETIDDNELEGSEYPDTGDILGYVNMDSLLDAINTVKEEYPDTFENILDDNYDANDADIFLQLATMGEIVYG